MSGQHTWHDVPSCQIEHALELILAVQGLALPALGRLRNGRTQIRAPTFYKMVHFVSPVTCFLALISCSIHGIVLLSPSADGKVPAQAMLLQLCSPGVPLADFMG